MKRILLTGGGSGGHITPLLAVARELERVSIEQKTTTEIYYIGPNDEHSQKLKEEGIHMSAILASKYRRYSSLQNILDVPKFFISLLQCFWKLFWLMPNVIFSKGGTGALPVVIAGWFYRIPILIHESDASPGLTNLLSARFASRIAVSFSTAQKYFHPGKTAVVGSPVRFDLLHSQVPTDAAKEKLGFDSKKHLIFVYGGSQGAQVINQFIVTNLSAILAETQIIHQTGRAHFDEVSRLARVGVTGVLAAGYKAVPYVERELALILSGADVVVSRAGSASIFEIAAFGKPAILIPFFESASRHQELNAQEFAQTGAAIVIEQNNLFLGIFINQLKSILNNPEISQKMSLASKAFFKENAAYAIAEELLRMA